MACFSGDGKGMDVGVRLVPREAPLPLFMGHPNWDTVVRQSDVTSKAPFPWEVCICVCLCAHMVFQTQLPALWLPLLFPAWAAPTAWAGSPSSSSMNASQTPHERGGAPTCAQPGTNPQVQSAGWQELPATTPLFSLRCFQLRKSGWERRQLYLLHHIRIIACFLRCLHYLLTDWQRFVSCSLAVTQMLYTQHPGNMQRQKYINIHK